MGQDIGQVRIDDLWKVVRAQLKVSSVTNPLGLSSDPGRADRIFIPNESSPDPMEQTLWGRIVLVPVVSGFESVYSDSRELDVSFLTLVEYAPYSAVGWEPEKTISAVQVAIYMRLRQFWPTLQHAIALSPVTLNRPAQVHPLRDPQSRMWYSSAEYVCRVAAKNT